MNRWTSFRGDDHPHLPEIPESRAEEFAESILLDEVRMEAEKDRVPVHTRRNELTNADRISGVCIRVDHLGIASRFNPGVEVTESTLDLSIRNRIGIER